MAGRTETSGLAGERDEKGVDAIVAMDAGEAFPQISALERFFS